MYVLIFSPRFPRLFYWSPETRGLGELEDDSGESYLRVEAEVEDISTQTETPQTNAPEPQPEVNPSVDRPANVFLRALAWFCHCFNMCTSNKKLLMIATSICACASFAFLCIAIATDNWIHMKEIRKGELNSTKVMTHAGLWRRCNFTEAETIKRCTYIDFFEQIDREGLGPTEIIILSMRRMTLFPLFSVLILLVGQIVCFMGHCNHKRKIHTFAAGILYVVGGLCTLIGIILFIGGITAEASHKKTVGDEQAFEYFYGASFHLTVTSFVVSELTGVLSVYLYISRHKHAYKKKQERYTVNEQPSTSQANSRNYQSRSRSLSRERSHDYSPSHSDTFFTYTPVSDTSKDMSNYTFPRDPSRFTIAGPADARYTVAGQTDPHMYRSHGYSSHSVHDVDTYANRREMDMYSNRREMDMYSNRREMDMYSNRREMDTYSNKINKEDPYARRTTPV